MENKELICIGCPMGCALTVVVEDGNAVSVSGNTCPKGAEYGRNEVLHPVRTLTSTVRIEGRDTMLPVRTLRPIPKERVAEAMKRVNAFEAKAPVRIGDVLLDDLFGSPLIATMDIG